MDYILNGLGEDEDSRVFKENNFDEDVLVFTEQIVMVSSDLWSANLNTCLLDLDEALLFIKKAENRVRLLKSLIKKTKPND